MGGNKIRRLTSHSPLQCNHLSFGSRTPPPPPSMLFNAITHKQR